MPMLVLNDTIDKSAIVNCKFAWSCAEEGGWSFHENGTRL